MDIGLKPLEKIFRKGEKEKAPPKGRIASISLKPPEGSVFQGIIARDLEKALHDLETESFFQPVKDKKGPYTVELYLDENRLVFHMANSKGKDLPYLVLSLKPYQRIVKDYFLIVQSYDEAMRDGKPSRIEAIDMGRRGLHNEGAGLLAERLEGKITLDNDTARRLFTLICVLHTGKHPGWL